MNYQRIKDGKVQEIPVRVHRGPGVEEVYAHGAAGNNVANYHVRIDFYRDIFPPSELTLLGKEVVEEDNLEIERVVVASVLMPLPFVKELRNWLNARIEQIEQEHGEIRLANQPSVPDSAIPKKKQL
jgi:hypothetical protein